jgi:hypothetical protein
MDWYKAEEYLKTCEAAYAETGTAGAFALNVVIRPLRDRFNKNERSEDLYREIMGISL